MSDINILNIIVAVSLLIIPSLMLGKSFSETVISHGKSAGYYIAILWLFTSIMNSITDFLMVNNIGIVWIMYFLFMGFLSSCGRLYLDLK